MSKNDSLGINELKLQGIVVKQPELRKDKKGNPMTRLTLKVEHVSYDEDGAERYNLNYFPVTIFGEYAREISKAKLVGTPLYIRGSLSRRNDTDADGNRTPRWSVIAGTDDGDVTPI